jgi:hypothetical protein
MAKYLTDEMRPSEIAPVFQVIQLTQQSVISSPLQTFWIDAINQVRVSGPA